MYRYRDNPSLTWKIQSRNNRSLMNKEIKGQPLSLIIKEFVNNEWNTESEDRDKLLRLYKEEYERKSSLFGDICGEDILFRIFLYMGGMIEDFISLALICRRTMLILRCERFYVYFCKRYYPSYSKHLRIPYMWKGYWYYLSQQTVIKANSKVPVPEVLREEVKVKDIALKLYNNEYLYIIRSKKGITLYNNKQQAIFHDNECMNLSNPEEDLLAYTTKGDIVKLVSINGALRDEIKVEGLSNKWIYSHSNIFAWDKGLKIFDMKNKAWTRYGSSISEVHANNMKVVKEKNVIVSDNKSLNVYDIRIPKIITKMDNIITFDGDDTMIAGYNLNKKIEFYDYRNLKK